ERAPGTRAGVGVLVSDDAAHVAPAEEVVAEAHGPVVAVCERLRRGRAVRAAAVVDELALYGLARARPAHSPAARVDRLDRPLNLVPLKEVDVVALVAAGEEDDL